MEDEKRDVYRRREGRGDRTREEESKQRETKEFKRNIDKEKEERHIGSGKGEE